MIKKFESFNDFIDPPEVDLKMARNNDIKFLMYTKDDGWFAGDFLLDLGYIHNESFKEVEQITKVNEFDHENMNIDNFLKKYGYEYE
ncbi:MAG: hypothetical protein KDH96_12125 [Candidatus Riesia sp.]|nr:hypothetical protein [Candidatus Riesia sp.]